MNSVFSAFKTNKSDKHSSSATRSNIGNNSNSNNSGSNGSGNINNITTQKKLLNNGQENSYENLRHLREIGTSTKMMTSIIVNDDVEDDLLLHNRTILKTANLNENDGYIQPLPKSSSAQQLLTTTSQNYSDDDDEVDHNFELDSTNLEMKLQEMKNEISMKRNLLNGNCCNNINGKINNIKNYKQNNCDKIKLSSTASAPATSSTTSLKVEDYDKNTSIQSKTSTNINSIDESQHQQINSHLPQPNSPAKSLSNTSISSSSSSASCNDVTTIVSSLATDSKTISDSNNYNCNNGIIGNIFNGPVGIVCSAKPPNSTIPIIMANKNRNNNQQQQMSSVITNTNIITTNSAATTPKATRYNKPRLSLSSFNNSNSSMPSVHGRSSIITNGTNNGGQPKRLSNHQRNLSLDFRSMGILLPPVSQVTNTRINLTQHHRNRSLDSALQRIPEVEVSSPNAEPESTFCTNSILGSTMCSKIVSSSTTEPPLSTNLSESSSTVSSSSLTTTNSQNTPIIASSATQNITVEPCTRQKPIVIENSYQNTTTTTDHHHHQSVPNNKNIVENKKREDLTSLGSDDSGIICGSESDQVSLNRIRHSHESLDSGEMDPEEECIEILETTSMDEEYRMLQSDLCFYQTPEKDLRKLTTRRKPSSAEVATAENTDDDIEDISNNKNILKTNRIFPINIENDDDDEDFNNDNDDTQKLNTLDSTEITPQDEKPINIKLVSAEQSATTTTTVTKPNEILFKNFNFFGATKNVIFRTAQSIIENHEKKIAAKNHKSNVIDSTNIGGGGVVNNTVTDLDIKSPTEISKKKEFFVLKSSSNKNKIAAAVTPVTITPQTQQNHSQPTTPETPLPPPQFPIVTNSTTVITTPTSIIATTTSPIPQSSSLSVVQAVTSPEIEIKSIAKSNSISSLHKIRVPGVVKCFIREKEPVVVAGTTQLQTQQQTTSTKTEKGPSGLLRFFESPIFNIHFAIHYLFYSKEPGVLSFIGNKIFNFSNQEVDLYIPQLIVMYIQMDELAEVLDPYLTIRCRKSVDFSLKCLWLLEAYNYQFDTVSLSKDKKTNLSLMKELYSKKERKQLLKTNQQTQQVISPLAINGNNNNGTKTIKQYQQLQQPEINNDILSPIKKTHHRSQSDATGLLNDSSRQHYPTSMVTGVNGVKSFNFKSKIYTPVISSATTIGTKLCLGDLTSGRAFDNGCICFESVRGTVNDLLGQKTVCYCGAPKTSPQKEFMKALINVGKNLTQYQTKAEKTSALRILLNLINKNLPARVWLPLHSDDIPHHIVRITEEKTAVLNSKDKTPYIIYVEVVEVNDIYTSPVILKMMPTLRHTKSEEHLETNCPHHNHHHHPQHQQQQQQQHLNIMKKDSNNLLCNRNTGAGDNNNCTGINKIGTKVSECSNNSDHVSNKDLNDIQNFTEDDVWSQEDDEITAQYLNLHKISERDAISQMSLDSCDSRDQGIPTLFNIGDVRTRHCNNLTCENTKPFSNDPEDPSAAALKEPWHEKERQIRESSPYGHLSNWKLLSAIVKCGDDLRQELMATQLLQMFKLIWQEENVDMWVRPYKIVCLSDDSGLIEPILNTVSLHQIKKNSNKSLKDYFIDEYGEPDGQKFQDAQKNFVQSCAAYCLISYLLQVKDRHNGNILLHSDGHLIHIDFGFILSISPKNLGFEQSPFKLTAEFVEVMGGTSSELWTEFNHLLLKGLMAARKHMDRIINLVEIMRSNAQLPCFKNGCSGTVQNLRKRFHMNLTEQELERKVEQLVQDSLKSLSTKLYDGYQYFTNGIL